MGDAQVVSLGKRRSLSKGAWLRILGGRSRDSVRARLVQEAC